ncbi:hypothetical protein Tco_0271388 [Tanacetum coccineum]|uniref:Uncharacterized protein n=1 Tax=Tanacetum coccineum TaxID=301880 RepID=A0ABQ5HDR7_9ASTR
MILTLMPELNRGYRLRYCAKGVHGDTVVLMTVTRARRTKNQYAIVATERGMLVDPKSAKVEQKRFIYTIPMTPWG